MRNADFHLLEILQDAQGWLTAADIARKLKRLQGITGGHSRGLYALTASLVDRAKHRNWVEFYRVGMQEFLRLTPEGYDGYAVEKERRRRMRDFRFALHEAVTEARQG